MDTKRVAVVGAGISGLVAALCLRARGYHVTVCDRQRVPGGRLFEAHVGPGSHSDGYIDAGETELYARFAWEEFFRTIGEPMHEHLPLQRQLHLGTHYFQGGSRLELFADAERSMAEVERFAGSAEARAYRTFLRHIADLYREAEETVLRARARSLWHWTRVTLREGWGPFVRMKGHRSFASVVASFFQDPRLRQLFSYEASRIGLSPHRTAGTFAWILHALHTDTYVPETSMRAIAWNLERLATRRGVRFVYGEAAVHIAVDEHGVTGLSTDARHVECTAVVYAGDLRGLAAGSLGSPAARACPSTLASPSCATYSTLRAAGVANVEANHLARKAIFHADDPALEWASLDEGRMPPSSTWTLTLPDRGNEEGPSGEGAERILLAALAPPLSGRAPNDETSDETRLERAKNVLGFHGIHLRWNARSLLTPSSIDEAFPGSDGALFGPGRGGRLGALRMPAARTNIRGLYLASRGVHPGPSLSLACIRGKAAADELAFAEDRST